MTTYTDSNTAKASIEYRLDKNGVEKVMRSTIIGMANDYGVTPEWAIQVANDAGYSIVEDEYWVSDVEGSVGMWTPSIAVDFDLYISVNRPQRGRDRVETDAQIIERLSKLVAGYQFNAFKQDGKPSPAVWTPSFDLAPELERLEGAKDLGRDNVSINFTCTLHVDQNNLNLTEVDDLSAVIEAARKGFTSYMGMKVMAENRRIDADAVEIIDDWGFTHVQIAEDFLR